MLDTIANHPAAYRPPLLPGGRGRRTGYTAGTLSQPLFHLRHLLAAGVPLTDALTDVAALEPRGARRALWSGAAERVDAGAGLARAFVAFPREFDATALALVRAGEASGRLVILLGELEAHLRWRHELAARLRTATLYPAFATLLLLGVVGFLLGHVVPLLADFLAANGAPLAWHGKLLLDLGEIVGRHGAALAVSIAVMFMLFLFAPRFGEAGHLVHDATILRVWRTGPLVAALATARWARATALLYRAGVPLDEALAIAEGTLGNRVLERELAEARRAVLAGLALGAALAECRSVPPTFARLVRAGEAAGALGDALDQGAAQLRQSSAHTIARLEALTGPALLCITGALLLWIVVSVLSPLYAGAASGNFT